MDKHEQAQRFAEIILEAGLKGHWDMVGDEEFKGIAHDAWLLADAMQAEAEKRECKERPDVLKEEWQPDWSQAPEWANWWAIDIDKNYYWYEEAPSFGLTGLHIVERPHGF